MAAACIGVGAAYFSCEIACRRRGSRPKSVKSATGTEVVSDCSLGTLFSSNLRLAAIVSERGVQLGIGINPACQAIDKVLQQKKVLQSRHAGPLPDKP